MTLERTCTPYNKNKLFKWLKRSRKIIQILIFLLFLFFLVYYPNIEIFFRINPLTGISAQIAGRKLIDYFWPGILLLFLTVIFGRVWCSWICPLGTLLDFAGFRKKRKNKKTVWSISPGILKHDFKLRGIKYILLIAILIAAVFGNLTLLITDPITILTRTLTVSIIPAINHVVTSVEKILYNFEPLNEFVNFIESIIRGTILPYNLSYYTLNIFFGFILLVIILLNLLAHRFWCRYLCPFGALLSLVSRVSIFRRKVTPNCSNCSSCDYVCNMGAIYRDKGYNSDISECTMCLDCFNECPQTGISIGFYKRVERVTTSGLTRRRFLIGLGIATIGTILLQGDVNKFNPDKNLIRPPGSNDELKFLKLCIRCGQCMRICPTSGLQPVVFEGGVEALWTPVLIPRLGACDYNCNLCGTVCPTGAINTLSLYIKQKTPIGKAYVNHSRCLEWAEGADCLICREFCPLPVKAVEKRIRYEINQDGKEIMTHGPYIEIERCIGCGICENLCPVDGDAAIRVSRIS